MYFTIRFYWSAECIPIYGGTIKHSLQLPRLGWKGLPVLSKNKRKRLFRRSRAKIVQQWEQETERSVRTLAKINAKIWRQIADKHEKWHKNEHASVFPNNTDGKRQAMKTAKTTKQKGLHTPKLTWQHQTLRTDDGSAVEFTFVRGVTTGQMIGLGFEKNKDFLYSKSLKAICLPRVKFSESGIEGLGPLRK